LTWSACKLGDLLRVEHGFAFKGEHFSDEGELVVLTPGNFHEQGGFRPRPGKDRFYAAAFPDRYLLKAGDLVIAMTEQGEGLLGSSAVIPESNRYLHNQRIGLVKERPDRACRRFLYYLFNTPLVREQIRNTSSGAKVRHTSPERIYGVTVHAPRPEMQTKIAAILSAYDDLIANNQRRIALLEGMAEEIYREWFVRLRFPTSAATAIEHGVPAGWSLVPTVEAFKYHGGATPSKDVPRYWSEGTVHWYTPTDITGASGIFIEESSDKCTEEGLESCSATLFPPYTVMMTSRATIGAIGINLEPACTNQGFIACVPNDRYPLTYLYHWLKLAKPHFEMLSGGATFAELTKGTFKRIKILTPPVELVEAFDALVKPMFQEMESLIRSNRRLKESRDALLPRLISGKLKVDHLDIRLPPSMQAEAEATA
jgi:type I restriction enzyme, S subunit